MRTHFFRNLLILLFIVGTSGLIAVDLTNTTIYIADDAAEWPPYTFRNRQNENEIIGFSIDIIDRIFADNNIQYHIDLLPWARALAELESGHKYKVILNASYSSERAEKFLLSDAYYQTTGCYFYSTQKFPNGLNIHKKEDLKDYNVGGIFGYNYSHYGLINENIDRGAKDYAALIQKLHLGRVEIFLENYEILKGFGWIGKDYLADSGLGYGTIEDVPPINFYMLFTKDEVGKVLQKIVNDGLKKLKESGEYGKLYQKYFE